MSDPREECEQVWDVARRGDVLAVVAHPDDESFGLGAVLAELAAAGAAVDVVCLTHGEASTLGAVTDLGAVRERELAAAAHELGLRHVRLHDFGDGRLAEVDPAAIDRVVDAAAPTAATVVAFEPCGVTGHPDHRVATEAAWRFARRRGAAVVEWGVHPAVAATLDHELGTTFCAFDRPGTCDVAVDRTRQLAAIARHTSQATANAVLLRRLELEGAAQRVRVHLPAEVGGDD